MIKRKLVNWFCLTGILHILFYLLHDVIGAMNYPGYQWMSQAVSDLSAVDAPSGILARGISGVAGLFSITCISFVCVVIQEKGTKILRVGIYLFALMNWVSAIGYTLFPLTSKGYQETFQDVMHVFVVTTAVVLLSIVSLLMIIIGGLQGSGQYKSLSLFALAALIFMFVGAIGTGAAPKEYFGIVERFSTYSAVIFNGILGIYGFYLFDKMVYGQFGAMKQSC